MSDNEIDAMLNDLNFTAKKVSTCEYGLPLYDLELMALQSVVRKHLQPQPIPLPTVPADATCGGCRWWHPGKGWASVGCYAEVKVNVDRVDYSPACRHYVEAAK